MSRIAKTLYVLALVACTNAFFAVNVLNILTTERLDPIVNPGKVSGHVHTIIGGSNFGSITNTSHLRQSQCTSMPIQEDFSNYWVPALSFHWANGSFSFVKTGARIYYLFPNEPGKTTPFPDDFRMIAGSPTLRTYDAVANNRAQKGVNFQCIDAKGVYEKFSYFPKKACLGRVRGELNFPNCWNGKDLDSLDHKSHVAFGAQGPGPGSCKDPKFPIQLPRIFIEIFWDTPKFESYRAQAMNPTQPFVFSHGDPTGYGFHGDFLNGWKEGVLQKIVDGCNCSNGGDTRCCEERGLFTMNRNSHCSISPTVDEQVSGILDKLPGNNPVQPEGKTATMFKDPDPPGMFTTVTVYTDKATTSSGKPVTKTSKTPTPSHTPTSSTKSKTTTSFQVPTDSAKPEPVPTTALTGPKDSAGTKPTQPVTVPSSSPTKDVGESDSLKPTTAPSQNPPKHVGGTKSGKPTPIPSHSSSKHVSKTKSVKPTPVPSHSPSKHVSETKSVKPTPVSPPDTPKDVGGNKPAPVPSPNPPKDVGENKPAKPDPATPPSDGPGGDDDGEEDCDDEDDDDEPKYEKEEPDSPLPPASSIPPPPSSLVPVEESPVEVCSIGRAERVAAWKKQKTARSLHVAQHLARNHGRSLWNRL